MRVTKLTGLERRAAAVVLVFSASLALACKGKSDASPKATHPAAIDGAPSQVGPAASDAAESPPPTQSAHVIVAPLPNDVLVAIVGCFRLEDRERWRITRTAKGGARVTRELLPGAAVAGDSDYARRAAIPSDILYDAADGSLAFSSAGPIHAQLFVFKPSSAGLAGSWAVSRAPGEKYAPSAGQVTVHRCAAEAEGRRDRGPG